MSATNKGLSVRSRCLIEVFAEPTRAWQRRGAATLIGGLTIAWAIGASEVGVLPCAGIFAAMIGVAWYAGPVAAVLMTGLATIAGIYFPEQRFNPDSMDIQLLVGGMIAALLVG